MAKIIKSISLLLVVMACCFLRETISTAEEDKREGKQILLSPAVAPFPFYYYANSPLYTGVPKSSSLEGRVSSKLLSPPDDYSNNDATSRTFFRIFGCPTCPTCPSPVVCPICPVCLAVPVLPAATIALTPIAATECLSNTLLAAASITPCSRVSTAPSGTIAVTFNDAQSVSIVIVAVSPKTQIKLTCTAIPTGATSVAKTQLGAIAANAVVTGNGFLQIIASSVATQSLTCSWVSA